MTTYHAFADESGKESGSRAFILTTVTFESEQATLFEERVWRWRSDSELFTGKEIKLKKLLEKHGYEEEKLDSWRAILQETDFRWFTTLVPLPISYQIQGQNTPPDVLAGLVGLNRFAILVEGRDSSGTATFDHNIGEGTLPTLIYDAKLNSRDPRTGKFSKHWRKLLGQVNYANSSLVPELWIADGISYLIHRGINQRRWRKGFNEIWSVIREKVWLSKDAQLNGWGLDVFPLDERIEAEASQLILEGT